MVVQQNSSNLLSSAVEGVLAWWRSVERDELMRWHSRLFAEVCSRTRGKVPDALISGARQAESRPAKALSIAEALHLAAADHDLVMSWVAVAAISGNLIAHRMVADALISNAVECLSAGDGIEAVLLFDRAADWFEECEDINLTCDVVFSGFRRSGLRHALEALDCGATVQRRPSGGPAENAAPDADQPTLLVVEDIGDRGGKEGADIANRYKSLMSPLALRGGRIPPEVIATALQLEFPWLQAAIELVVQDLVLMHAAGIPWIHINPTLLVGPPGTGKTRFAQRLGTLAGTGTSLLSAAGSSDNRALMGTARGWSSAQPAFPLLTMARTGSANPVIVVDEVDKTSTGGRNGEITSTLLTMMERESAKAWMDECLLASCDLTQISWLLTANATQNIPKPLLSRVRIVYVGTPRPEHFDSVLAGILRDIASEMMLQPTSMPELDPTVVNTLRAHFARGTSVRKLRAAVVRALSYAFIGTRQLH